MKCHRKSFRRLRTRNRWLAAGILLLFYFILPAVYSPAYAQKSGDAKKAQALYEKALQKKSAAERIQLLEQAAQLFADDQSSTFPPEIARQLANIHGALGRELYQQARWQAAISHLEKALALDSSLLPVRATLGLAYFQQGQYDAAIQTYGVVLRAQPNAQLYNNLGAAHETKGDLAAAVAAYTRALELDASLGLAQKNLQRAQAKLSRMAVLKSAFNDSVRKAAKARDSLAVATAKSLKGNSKTKTEKDNKTGVTPPIAKPSTLVAQSQRAANPPKGKETETKTTTSKRKDAASSPSLSQTTKKPPIAPALNPRSSQPSVLATQGASKPTVSKKETPLAVRSSQPLVSKKSARDSAATQIKSALSLKASPTSETPISHSSKPSIALNPSPSVAEESKSPEVSIPRAEKPSPSLVGPMIFGLSAFLLTALAVMQRRRLGYVWLQLKPALATSTAAVSRQVRFLPSRLHSEFVAYYERARRIKLLPSPRNGVLAEAPLEAESPEPAPVLKSTPDEPRQTSLQTQAFFAEMIAAEPEIEEFDEAVPAKSDEAALPANGHVHHASVKSPLSPVVVENHNGTRKSLGSEQLAVISDQLSVISEQSPEISDQLSVVSDQFPTTNNQQPATSRSAAEIAPQRDNQPKRSEDPASAGHPVEAQRRSRHSGTTSRSVAEIPPQRDNQSKRSEDPASAGQPVLGRYIIEQKIGKGAMGNVYLAQDPKLDRRVVIKTVCFNLATSETDTLTLKDRVYREARAIAKLGHPNIVVVYDVEDDKDMSYIVMEHIEGRDIRQALASEHRFEVARASKIVSQVCSALDYAHQAGIIHRDIKPSNIMLLPGDKAKVTDFGIAKIADNFSLTLPGHVLGTPSYMAPEQFEGMEIDARADIFSLGVVFYELITGCRPFAGNSLASLAYKIVHKMHIPPSLQNVELPLELDDIVGRALAKNPEERYATALEFREALQTLQVEAAHSEAELAQ
jgi:tRNA A-37 threonylcarbamoyl transferase component Bud32/Flp pilus assembly protein TadD